VIVLASGYTGRESKQVSAPGEFHHPGLGLGLWLRFRVTVRVRVSVRVRVNVIDRVGLGLGLGLGIGIGLGTAVVKFSGSAQVSNKVKLRWENFHSCYEEVYSPRRQQYKHYNDNEHAKTDMYIEHNIT